MASQKGHGPLPVDHVCRPTANQLLRPLHDRIPVILAPADHAAWLGEGAVRGVAELLQPYPSEEMRAYRASTAVNGVSADGPECAAAVA